MFATYMNVDVPAEPALLHAELRSDMPAAYLAGSLQSVPLNLQAPEPHAVNEFFWELLNFRKLNPDKWVVVHCTHGYNRTGKGYTLTAQHTLLHVASNATPPNISISSCNVRLVSEEFFPR